MKSSFNYQYVYVTVRFSLSNTFLTIVAIKTNEYRQKNITLKCEHAYRCSNLLQIVMVSPGTHFVKNHGSQSRNNESQLKKNHYRFFRAVRNLPLMSL